MVEGILFAMTSTRVINTFTPPRTRVRLWPIATLIYLVTAPLYGTPPFGFTSQTFRGKITENVSAYRWNADPLFTLLIQSSPDQWGVDVVQGTTEFAPADATGRPSQSGWHDHPTAVSVALVIQGTVWSHAAGASCLHAFPTGSVFFEREGQIHNNYNLDPRTPAVVRIIHFVDRNRSATRRDQADPATGSTTASSPPPPPCPADTPSGAAHGMAHVSVPQVPIHRLGANAWHGFLPLPATGQLKFTPAGGAIMQQQNSLQKDGR